MSKVLVYLFDVRHLSYDEINTGSYLNHDDYEALKRYKVEEVRKEKLISLYLKRKYVGEYEIDSNGKPLSKNTYFNISHSHGLIAIALAKDCPIGIDIEIKKEYKDDLARFISNDEEYSYIKDITSFYEIWTSKESLVKCIGSGIKTTVNTIKGLPINGLKEYKDKNYYVKTLSEEDYVLSITLEIEKEFELEIRKGTI